MLRWSVSTAIALALGLSQYLVIIAFLSTKYSLGSVISILNVVRKNIIDAASEWQNHFVWG
ncbi:hypothetical protein [Brunnivagina elsteri]|uniref:Uncharacterized protein n=1 Tax=Brunnivagina elsteri CCALA 953 TaxID=987040 RepID=A0A2A2TBA7_9CYAN|nr:hypothetical protein [Calothrix elsteri]PAX51077.1 hypothetical protein CK510_26790 [Calothrix elsteri CCALA 953]